MNEQTPSQPQYPVLKRPTGLKRGPKSKFDEKIARRIYYFLQNGDSPLKACAKVQLPLSTYYHWKKHNELFAYYVEVGEQAALAKNNDTYEEFMRGEKKCVSRLVERWAEERGVLSKKTDIIGGVHNTQVNITNTQVFQEKSINDIMDYITESLPDVADIIDVTEFEHVERKDP